jgi:hypothetical protein
MVIAAVSALLTGCGEPSTYEITGTVTLDGKPLNGGRIVLVASDGQSTTAAGDVEGGSFRIRCSPGPKDVKIEKTLILNPESDMPYLGQGIPSRYNTQTTLKIDVMPNGPMHFDFPLTSDKKDDKRAK